jgi:hypothetical protein
VRGGRVARDQGQVGYGSGHGQLEQRLGSAAIAGLARPQLDQSRDPVLGHLPTRAVLPEVRGGLKGARRLEERFLRVEEHAAATAPAHAL